MEKTQWCWPNLHCDVDVFISTRLLSYISEKKLQFNCTWKWKWVSHKEKNLISLDNFIHVKALTPCGIRKSSAFTSFGGCSWQGICCHVHVPVAFAEGEAAVAMEVASVHLQKRQIKVHSMQRRCTDELELDCDSCGRRLFLRPTSSLMRSKSSRKPVRLRTARMEETVAENQMEKSNGRAELQGLLWERRSMQTLTEWWLGEPPHERCAERETTWLMISIWRKEAGKTIANKFIWGVHYIIAPVVWRCDSMFTVE